MGKKNKPDKSDHRPLVERILFGNKTSKKKRPSIFKKPKTRPYKINSSEDSNNHENNTKKRYKLDQYFIDLLKDNLNNPTLDDAVQLYQQEEYQWSIRKFEKVLVREPTNYYALLGKAAGLEHTKGFDSALNFLKEKRSKNSEIAKIYKKLK